uniref:phosphatidylinositol-3,4,5-trisphosphate 5-phosphatase n=1 Tax=Callorhinchus milii TaxID=7868 RepID=A0A4W3IR23_CALMI
MSDSWQHGTITRSRAEDLLSRAAEDGSFLVRASESISGAYALCVLYQNCVYTYRILPNEEKKLTVQASEGIKVKYFSKLTELIDYYMKQNMGLVTHLKHPVERDEEVDLEYEEIGKKTLLFLFRLDSSPKHGSESTKPLLSDVLIQRFQQIDTSIVPREYMNDLENYLRIHVVTDAEAVRAGNTNLPQLKKLLCTICKGLSSELNRTMPMLESVQKLFDQQLSGRTRTQVRYRYNVKSDGLGISTKIFLKVDVENGKMFIKKSKDGAEDKYYGQTKILQLIKSHKFHNRLVIVVGSEKEKTLRKEYVFADSKKREGFCQLLQQMKNKHSDHPEPDMITLFIGTWNMGDASPPSNIKAWFQSLGQGKTRDETAVYIPYDMYVVGTQEDQQGDKEWVEILKATLKDITSIDFKHVVTQTLWNIRIVIFAKPEHENRISHVSTNSVKTGIANALGNKGAVGVSLMFNGTSFGFVNSHLTSGAPKKLRRNQNYINILRLLTLGDKRLNPFDITNRFTHLFWLGDLNYRVDFPASEAENIIQKIKQQQYQELLVKDQLTLEKNDGKIFLQFQLEMSGTLYYKIVRLIVIFWMLIFIFSLQIKFNLPSWCDRVLWKSYPMVHVMCQSYGCTNDIMTSDHSPVFATYEVGVTSQFVSKNGPNNGDSQGKIEFLNCELTPIISDPEYLLDQHILICIKSTDSYESYGEGCIALRGESHSPEVAFNTFLTHQGEETGEFQGSYKLTTSEGKQRERTYGYFYLLIFSYLLSVKQVPSPDQKPSMWAFDVPPKQNPSIAGRTDSSLTSSNYSPLSPKKVNQMSPNRVLPLPLQDLEMFDNPLYASFVPKPKLNLRKDLEVPRGARKEVPPIPDQTGTSKYVETPGTKPGSRQLLPPVPQPRMRSFTCSEMKNPVSGKTHVKQSYHAFMEDNPRLGQPMSTPKSELEHPSSLSNQGQTVKPPLPAKSKQVLELQHSQKDYRETTELPNKTKHPSTENAAQRSSKLFR